MGYTAAPGQIPILCGHCGGAAEPEADGVGIVCPYCGSRGEQRAQERDPDPHRRHFTR